MASHITVKDLNHLYAMQNHEDGELAYVESEKKIYSWHPEVGWQLVEVNNKGLELDLYSLNKNIIGQLQPMTHEDVCNKSNIIFDFFTNTAPNKHYMLLCKEYNYYTIFEAVMPENSYNYEEDFVDAVLSIVEEVGLVYAIEEAESAVEFWIKPEKYDEPMVFILFPYDAGVVYYV